MHLWLTALLHNAHGRYGEALADARQACEHEDVMAYGWALVELIEAGVRDGQPAEAAAALDRLSERTQASGTEWALGIEARCRGLLLDDESLYRESIERLARSRAVAELARSRLLYGEWLRRENRRTDAREVLRAAHESFSHMGAEAFAERARRELLATGETVRRVTADTRDALTPQEVQVARLAREGHTNLGDRRPAVHQPAHGRVPPAQGLPQARRQQPQGASRRARGHIRSGRHGLCLGRRAPATIRCGARSMSARPAGGGGAPAATGGRRRPRGGGGRAGTAATGRSGAARRPWR